ncbi:helix-turn-helix domain-containing protein [Facklamia sp. P12955]|uniref:helix-turn-helix domain-containing protein n=1 Tax=Facklamia sp. P12955 TaxID=3421946 RepID=UPI003D17FE09
MKFSTRLKNVLKEKNMTQSELSKRTGISKSVISEWLSDKYEPKQDKVYIVADALSLSPSWLFGVSDSKSIDQSILNIYNQLNETRQNKVYSFAEHQLQEQKSELEYYGQTAAGDPLIGEQVAPIISDSLTVRLLVNGDSMEDLYHDGDIVTYKKQPTLENGEIGIFVLNGGVTMKKFKKNGDIRLQSLNDKYEDIVLTDKDDFTILGKVIK